MVQELEQAEEPVAADGKVCEVVSLGDDTAYDDSEDSQNVSKIQKLLKETGTMEVIAFISLY